MPHVFYDQNRITPEKINQYSPVIYDILSRSLSYPQVKKLAGMSYQGKDVFRAKTDKKERIIYTYHDDKGKKSLLLLKILEDHDYQKVKRQLQGTAKIAASDLKDNNVVVLEKDELLNHIKPIPTISYNQTTMILDETQQGLFQAKKTPLLLIGVPGGGKTALLYNWMLSIINHTQKPILFLSQSASSLKSLQAEYEQYPLEERPPIHFNTWEQLLQMHYPNLKSSTQEQFTQWLKRTKLAKELPHEIHYELSLITALGSAKYEEQKSRQSYYSDDPTKKQLLISTLKAWNAYLKENRLFDPMVTLIKPNEHTPYSAIFCDESQNLPPVGLLYCVEQQKSEKNLVAGLDIEQCLLSSPFILNCFKELLQTHIGSYSEHVLTRTWRNPPEIVEAAQHLIDVKHELDKRQRRLYNRIESAHPRGGVITWIDKSYFYNLHQYADLASTVVLAEHLSEEQPVSASAAATTPTSNKQSERATIFDNFKSKNILTSSQAIGLDFDVVILWKPFSNNPHFRSLYKKWQEKSSEPLILDESNAINSLYVSLTRSQAAVFIHETEKRWMEFGEYLLGRIEKNSFDFIKVDKSQENKEEQWKKTIEYHLTEKQFNIAKELMQSYLHLDEATAEERIRTVQQKHLKEIEAQQQLKQQETVVAQSKKTPAKKTGKPQAQNSSEPAAAPKKLPPVKKTNPDQKKPAPLANQNKGLNNGALEKYAQPILKKPTEDNVKSLLAHANAFHYLFQSLKDGSCLFTRLIEQNKVRNLLISGILKEWDILSPGLSEKMISKPYGSYNDITPLYFLADSKEGCELILKSLKPFTDTELCNLLFKPQIKEDSYLFAVLLKEQKKQAIDFLIPKILSNWDLFSADLTQKMLHKNKDVTPLFILSGSKSGCELLLKLLNKNLNIFDHLTPKDLFHIVSIEGQIDETLVFNLSQNEHGRVVLYEIKRKYPSFLPEMIESFIASQPPRGDLLHYLFNHNPELFDDFSEKILKTIPPNSGKCTIFHLLAQHGECFFNNLLARKPLLAMCIDAQFLLHKGANKNDKSIFYHLANTNESEGRYILAKLVKANPSLALIFTPQNLGDPDNQIAFRNLCYSNSGQGFLYTFIARNSQLKFEPENDLCHFGKDTSVFPWLTENELSQKLLKIILEKNPQIAKHINARELCTNSSHFVYPFGTTTSLFRLAVTNNGCHMLNLVMEQNPLLFKEITAEALTSKSVNPHRDYNQTSALYWLAKYPEGRKFLNNLLDHNPDLWKKINENDLCITRKIEAGYDMNDSSISTLCCYPDGGIILNKLIKLRPDLATHLFVKTLFLIVLQRHPTSSLYGLLKHEEGQDFLETLLNLDANLATEFTAEMLCTALSTPHTDANKSPLYFLSASEKGRRIFAKLIENNKNLALHITSEALTLTANAETIANTSPLDCLKSSPDGKAIIKELCAQNPSMAQKFSDLSEKDPTQTAPVSQKLEGTTPLHLVELSVTDVTNAASKSIEESWEIHQFPVGIPSQEIISPELSEPLATLKNSSENTPDLTLNFQIGRVSENGMFASRTDAVGATNLLANDLDNENTPLVT